MRLYRIILIVIAVILPAPVYAQADPAVKLPNVAGTFYAADPAELSAAIDGYMAAAPAPAQDPSAGIAIVPHAGYVFSGLVAAHAYKFFAGRPYSTIVVIGPSHFYPLQGAAVWPRGGFQTPLGTVSVDEEFTRALMRETAAVKELPAAFDKEHAVEVQLPFIQQNFPRAKIVPLLMGDPDFGRCEQLAVALNAVIGKRTDVLVLISSDMAHYRPYAANNALDERTFSAIQREDIEAFWNGNRQGSMEMCGFVPVTVGLMLAKLRGLNAVKVLKHANSGDISGDKNRVVGYGAVIFHRAPDGALTWAQQQWLLSLARVSIETFVKGGAAADAAPEDARLMRTQGAFVTLMKKGQLRGCIGSIIGEEPLAKTVRDMAIAAASTDPRFPPVTADELADLHVEISVLSTPARIRDASAFVPGRDGVIVSGGGDHQGVFLPQVATETGWGKEELLAELCAQKAGLKPDCWKDPAVSLFTFTAEVFGEK